MTQALRPTPRSPSDPVPLTFTQREWWNRQQLDRRSSARTVAAAVQLSGRLDIRALQRSFTELIRRHESLRTRIETVDGIPRQVVEDAHQYELEVVELWAPSQAEREREARRRAEELVGTPHSVATDRLWTTRLLRLGERDHVLVVAMDHIIADAASLGILWQEVFSLYEQCVQGLPCDLASTSIQFPDYAVWQQKTQQRWMERHGAYWVERLAGAQRVRLFAGEPASQGESVSWGTFRLELEESLGTALKELSRRERTTLVMSLLTVFAATLLRWCRTTDVVVPFLSMGRLHTEVRRTIGYFGAPLFLRIQLSQGDTFRDLLRRVGNERALAYSHHDAGRVLAQIPAGEYIGNPWFNWIPETFNTQPIGPISDANPDATLSVRAFELERRDVAERSDELRLVLSDVGGQIVASIRYKAGVAPLSCVERFAQAFHSCAWSLAHAPNAPIAEGTPSP